MGKICPKCGKELRETARFCTSCGTKLEEGIPGNPVNTVNVQNGSINTVMPKQEKKWYQKTGWIIALLIVFFPVGLYLMWKYTDWRKVLKIAVSIVCAVCLVIGFFSTDSQDGGEGSLPGSDYNGSAMSLSDFLERYNEISQNKFAENGIDRQPISIDDLIIINEGIADIFKDNVVVYEYQYSGWTSIPGSIAIAIDMNNMVVWVGFTMSAEFLASSDTFQNAVLDSLMQAFMPTLSEEGIYKIRDTLSMESPLISAMRKEVDQKCEYDGISCAFYTVSGGLNFIMYTLDNMEEWYQGE